MRFRLSCTAYLGATLSYGVLRKGVQLRHATIAPDYRDPDSRVPMLLVDKVVVTALSGAASPYLWPVYIYEDLRATEVRCRLYDPTIYETVKHKRHWSDYLF